MKSIKDELGGDTNEREVKEMQKKAEDKKMAGGCKRNISKRNGKTGKNASKHTGLFGGV